LLNLAHYTLVFLVFYSLQAYKAEATLTNVKRPEALLGAYRSHGDMIPHMPCLQEYFQALSRESGYDLRLQFFPPKRALSQLFNKSLDGLYYFSNDLVVADHRLNRINESLIYIHGYLYFLSDHDPRKTEELNGQKVAYLSGTFGIEDRGKKSDIQVDYFSTQSIDQMINLLISRRVDMLLLASIYNRQIDALATQRGVQSMSSIVYKSNIPMYVFVRQEKPELFLSLQSAFRVVNQSLKRDDPNSFSSNCRNEILQLKHFR